MADLLQNGPTGAPFPPREVVLRLIKASKDGKVLETHFALSSRDEESALRSLSVWAEKLTTPEQAREFMGEATSSFTVYCRLAVARVRALTLPDLPERSLNVVWDTLFLSGTAVRDTRPGAEGHAGITGLLRPPGMEKRLYKALRVRLADIANEDLHSVG